MKKLADVHVLCSAVRSMLLHSRTYACWSFFLWEELVRSARKILQREQRREDIKERRKGEDESGAAIVLVERSHSNRQEEEPAFKMDPVAKVKFLYHVMVEEREAGL